MKKKIHIRIYQHTHAKNCFKQNKRINIDTQTCEHLHKAQNFIWVWTSFFRHSPDWRVVKNFHSPNQETTHDRGRKNQRLKKKSEWGFIFSHQT
jgi:hypothetical protein